MARMIQRDIVIVNSTASSVMNDANLKTIVPGGKDGIHMSFKAPLYLGHVGEFHYISLAPSSLQPDHISEAEADLDNNIMNSVVSNKLTQHGNTESNTVVSKCLFIDIGYVVDNRCNLTDLEKLHFATSPWTPPADFSCS